MNMTLADLIVATKPKTPAQIRVFHELRQSALKLATVTYDERAASYNVDHEPFEEMPFGVVSLASEIFKRSIRMTGLLTPLRDASLTEADLARLLDTSIDLINYGSWMYALVELALQSAKTKILVDSGHSSDPDKEAVPHVRR